MKKIELEIETRFGKWTTTGKAVKHKGTWQFPCRCDCGNETHKNASELRKTDACRNCAAIERWASDVYVHSTMGRPKGSGVIDIPLGRIDGKQWTVIGPAQRPEQSERPYQFLCRCDCGKEQLVNGTELRAKDRSFGCRQCDYENLTGKKFGKWTVKKHIPIDERLHGWADWLAECVCGNQKAMGTSELKKKATKKSTGCFLCFDRIGTRRILRPYEAVFNRLLACAKTRGKKVTLTFKQFLNIIKPRKCHYCHVPMMWHEYSGPDVKIRYQLDRKNNDKGYVPGNVVSCCKRCNYQKGRYFSYAQWYAMTECYRNGTMAA
jgi:hypothetical protein